MDAYLDRQAQQIDRARTFAEIRQIEDRVTRTAPADTEPRRKVTWPFGALTARRRRAAVPCDAQA